MDKYDITGMSCAACSARVEKAINEVTGVVSCNVNLLTNEAGVEGTAKPADIIKAVKKAGYGASLREDKAQRDDSAISGNIRSIAIRLVASVAILLPLMYVSMGNMMWGWPVPAFMSENHFIIGIYEMVLTVAVMIINRKFFISGVKGVFHGAPNMDTLVALGSAASFGYSVYSLIVMRQAQIHGDHMAMAEAMNGFYFESAAMILTLITVGKLLEAKAKGRTTDAIKGLMKLAPQTAVLLRGDEEVRVPIAEVKVGDHFVVKSGDSIPVDGIVLSGNCAVDEAALTGESIPVDKESGDMVSAATINKSGYAVCEATRVGEDTTLSQIIRMVSDAAATKAPIAKIADRVSGVFVPIVLGIAAITFVVWIIVTHEWGYSIARAVSVLVISCPCALGLATPVAIMVGNGVAAKNGVLFKTAVSLEETGKINIIALDKTGTITKGEPGVTGIFPADGTDEEDILQKAYSLESMSEHPLSRAIIAEAEKRKLQKYDIEEFSVHPGQGLAGRCCGKMLVAGNESFISSKVKIASETHNMSSELAKAGNTPVFIAEEFDGKFVFRGIIAIADRIKEDSAEAIAQLKKLGIHVVMLTGDNKNTAESIGKAAGVDEVVAGVKPDGKEKVIRELQKYGKVAMVGDGINDAPALTSADIGIAIGAGTDIAIDAADIVLMKSSLADVAAAVRISRKTLKNIHENLFWAFFYNVVGIPLAAGVWIPIFGWTLSPMFGAAAMSLSSFCVVMNALRLNLLKVYNDSHDRAGKNALQNENLLAEYILKNEKEDNKTMEIIVTGMMCGHCEAHVKAALEKIDGVEQAVADHNTNSVVITTSAEVSVDAIKAAVEGEGYQFGGVK